MRIIKLDEVDSTQNIAKKLCEEVEEDFVVVAKRQTSGYGRKGNIWFSPEGGLWFTLAIKNVNKKLELVPIIVAVSVAKMLERIIKINIQLKWPNDIYINNRKIGGIICEATTIGESLNRLLIGVGINVNIDEMPMEISYKSTSIKIETGREYNIMEILREIIKEIYANMSANMDEILREWRDRDIIVGRKVKILLTNKNIEAKVIEINSDGSITIEYDNKWIYLNYWQVNGIEILNSI